MADTPRRGAFQPVGSSVRSGPRTYPSSSELTMARQFSRFIRDSPSESARSCPRGPRCRPNTVHQRKRRHQRPPLTQPLAQQPALIRLFAACGNSPICATEACLTRVSSSASSHCSYPSSPEPTSSGIQRGGLGERVRAGQTGLSLLTSTQQHLTQAVEVGVGEVELGRFGRL